MKKRMKKMKKKTKNMLRRLKLHIKVDMRSKKINSKNIFVL